MKKNKATQFQKPIDNQRWATPAMCHCNSNSVSKKDDPTPDQIIVNSGVNSHFGSELPISVENKQKIFIRLLTTNTFSCDLRSGEKLALDSLFALDDHFHAANSRSALTVHAVSFFSVQIPDALF